MLRQRGLCARQECLELGTREDWAGFVDLGGGAVRLDQGEVGADRTIDRHDVHLDAPIRQQIGQQMTLRAAGGEHGQRARLVRR